MTFGDSRALSDTRVYAQDTAPNDTRDGVLWVDTSPVGRPITKVFNADDGQWENVNPPDSVGKIDAAETFAESDVTLGRRGVAVANESVELAPSSTYNAPSTQTYDLTHNSAGVRFNFNGPAPSEIAVTLMAGVGTVKRLQLENYDTSSDVTAVTGTWTGGDTITMPVPAGVDTNATHTLLAENSAGFTNKRSDVSYNINAGQFTLKTGERDGGSNTSYLYSFSNISFPATSGEVVVEWPHPADLFDWDSVMFQATEDTETVGVYVEESTDGGATWTEVAGPVARGDDIPVDPAHQCRLRVELSRANTANNPTLDAAYRRWVV